MSSFGGEALSRNRDAWFLYYYAPPDDSGLPELLPLGLISVLLAVLRVFGALDDVIIGWWSDRTSSRWGRRLPFILFGTPLSALFAFLIVVPPQKYFALGDNRDNSLDSRYWGFVPDSLIRGRPMFVYYSFAPDTAHGFAWLTRIRWGRIGEAID